MTEIVINAWVVARTQDEAVRAMEAFARAGVGLTLDGVNVTIDTTRKGERAPGFEVYDDSEGGSQ